MTKLFLKRYFVPLVTVAFALFITSFFLASTPFQYTFSIFLLVLFDCYLLRVWDDINDYHQDEMDNKVVFSKKTLIVFFIIHLISALILSIFICLWHLLVLIWLLIIVPLFIKNTRNSLIKVTYLPLLIVFIITTTSNNSTYQWVFPISSFLISFLYYYIKTKPKKNGTKYDIALVGGKAYHLLTLNIKRTPPFIVITTDDLVHLLSNVQGEITRHFINQEFAMITQIIDQFSLDATSFITSLKKNKQYAVRSSATGEDSNEHSYAGILESVLNVQYVDLTTAIKTCLKGAFSKRVYDYLIINNKDLAYHKLAIIIQEMVSADFSGVINTINPITNDPDQIVICATTGLGDKLVSGEVDSSNYYLNRSTTICEGPDILNNKIIKRLKKMIYEVISKTTTFQDIEFAVKNNKVFFLQARPITPYRHINTKDPRIVLDNANIIESYCGVTTPLTFSFIEKVYEAVYRQVLTLGKVSKKIMSHLDFTLKNLLYFYENKVYYHMNSWYHLNSLFPKQDGINAMEKMMGVKTKMAAHQKVKMSIWGLFKLVVVLFTRLRRIAKDSEKFLSKFDEVVTPYLQADLTNKTNEEIVTMFHILSDEILNDFSTPIVNDIGAMLYYNKLTKLVKRLNITDADGYISYLVGRQGDVASAMSAPLFMAILQIIKENPPIHQDFLDLDAQTLYQKYYQHPLLHHVTTNYIDAFGPRVIDELKLETITLYEDPTLLYGMLQNYLIHDYQFITHDNQQVFNITIPLRHHFSFKRLVKKTRFFIKNREKLRLKRTFIYSVVRRFFRQIGHNFTKAGLIKKIDDIFFLTQDEIFNYIKEPSNCDFQLLIEERKKDYLQNQTKPIINRIVLYPNTHLDIFTKNTNSDKNTLTGIPSGAGIVKGRANLVTNYQSANLQKGDILVTYRTDPGWVILFPLCLGMVVEKGSILSHSAVVAREMGIPAVVGVSGATTLIKNNDQLTVDAIEGKVTIHEKILPRN